MTQDTLERRISLLRLMDSIVLNDIGDDELYTSWIEEGIPDEAIDEEYEDIAADDDLYYECVKLFAELTSCDLHINHEEA